MIIEAILVFQKFGVLTVDQLELMEYLLLFY